VIALSRDLTFIEQEKSALKSSLSLLVILLVSSLLIESRAASQEGLTKEVAEKSIAEQFTALKTNAKKSGLPEKLFDSVQKQLAQGQKVKVLSSTLDLGGEIKMPNAVILRETKASTDKRPLFICMHGGGGKAGLTGPHTWEVNTSEYQTQMKMAVGYYKPDGVYFVPRMADDRLGRWWHKHNQVAFDTVINHAIQYWNVDPNRVYILGISEGGYGTDILAPFMADRFAGANAMAGGVGLGNPPANLRNLAFRTDVGEKDNQFDRSQMAQKFHAELDRLHELDKDGYTHSINVQAGRAHGIDYGQGIQWIVKHTRTPWPSKIVWVNQTMDGIRRNRFYWISIPKAPEKGDIRIDAVANKNDNTITLDVATLDESNKDGNRTHGKDNVAESKRTPMSGFNVELLLNDELLDLDKPITVIANGKEVFKKLVSRSADVIAAGLADRSDSPACPTAKITVTTP